MRVLEQRLLMARKDNYWEQNGPASSLASFLSSPFLLLSLPPFLYHFKGYLIKGHCLLLHVLAVFLQVQVTLTFHFSKFLEVKLKPKAVTE